MITIDVKTLLIYLVFIALIILLVYLTVLTKNMIKTVKETNKILEDTSVITGIAADRATEVDEIVGNVSDAVADVTKSIKGNQNVIGAMTNLIKTAGAFVNLFNKDKEQNK